MTYNEEVDKDIFGRCVCVSGPALNVNKLTIVIALGYFG